MSDSSEHKLWSLFTSGGILFVGLVFQLGLGFLARMLIARFLGKVDYGAVALGYTLLLSVSIIVLAGLDTGIGRYLPRFDEPEKRRGVLVSAFQIVVPLSIVAGVVVTALADPIATHLFNDPQLTPIIRVFGLTVPLTSFVRLTVGSIQGMQSSLPRVYIQNITLPLARFGLIAVALLLGFRAVGMAWAYAGAYVIATGLCLYYLVRHTPLLDDVRPASMHTELLTFSAPIMVTATMVMIFQNIDTFMLGALSTTGDVGIYNVVYPIATLHTVTLTAFGFLFMPVISEFHSNDNYDEMSDMYELVSKWIFFATLPLFLVVASFPEVVIRYTFGPEYVSGALALILLAVGFFIHSVSGLSGKTLTSIGRTRTIMYDNVLVATVNIGLNFLLIERYSFVGAALATTAGYVVMDGLYLLQLYRSTGMHPLRRELLGPGIAAIGLWGLLYVGVQSVVDISLITLFGTGVVFIIAYPLLILRFGGVERQDIQLLNTLEDRVGINLEGIRAIAKRLVS